MDKFSQALQIEYADKGVIIQVSIIPNYSFSKDHVLLTRRHSSVFVTGRKPNLILYCTKLPEIEYPY